MLGIAGQVNCKSNAAYGMVILTVGVEVAISVRLNVKDTLDFARVS